MTGFRWVVCVMMPQPVRMALAMRAFTIVGRYVSMSESTLESFFSLTEALMPGQARSPRSLNAPRSSQPAESGQNMRVGPSNAVMQDRLKASQGNAPQPVRANPAPWAAQNRSVRFEPVSRGALFQDGAAVEDVVQGQNGSRYLGDCWLLSALAAIANAQPKVLEDAITDHGDGTYTVRLHKQDTRGLMSSEDVRVEGTLPRTVDGQDAYAQRSDPTEMWVGIIEKAFASWKGGYGTLDGGIPSDALTALTGQSSETVFMKGADSGELSSSMQEAASAQRPMVAASRADLSLKKGGIVPGHGHTILNVNEEGGTTYITLRDPFAMYEPSGNDAQDGVFKLTLEEFQHRFQYASWTTGDAASTGR